jgi:putative oxidoreductase
MSTEMTVTGKTETAGKARSPLKIGPWVLRLAVAFIFVSSGLEKFSIGPGQEWIRIFAKIGLGDWFRYLTGAMEIAGGLLLVTPFATKAGVALLVTCMAGAIVCHLFVLGDPFSSIINVGLIVAILAAGRRPKPEDEDFTRLELR